MTAVVAADEAALRRVGAYAGEVGYINKSPCDIGKDGLAGCVDPGEPAFSTQRDVGKSVIE